MSDELDKFDSSVFSIWLEKNSKLYELYLHRGTDIKI